MNSGPRQSVALAITLCAACPNASGQSLPQRYTAAADPDSIRMVRRGVASLDQSTSIDASHQYTLAELIDLAERHNPATHAAWEVAKVRSAQFRIARSELLPTLTAVALAETTRQGVLFGDQFVRQTVGLFQPILRVNYLVFDFGERAGRIEASRDELLAAGFAFSAVHLQVLFETERRYYRLLNAAGQVDAAQLNLQNAQTVRKSVDAKLAVGLATLPDALEARAQEAQANYELQTAIGAVDIARGELLNVLGASPDEPIQVEPLSNLQLPGKLDEDVRLALQRGVTQRPELAEQIARKDAAETEIKEARSAFLPSINFSGFGGEVRAYGQQDQLNAIYAGPLENWNAHLELRWDVFDGGRRFAELARAHADVKRAEAEADRTRDQIQTEVWTAYVNLRTAFHQRDAAASLLVAARTSYQAALQSYQYGLRNTVDVITAQRQLAEASRLDVSARADLLTQMAEFAYRTGDLLTHPAASPRR